MGLAVLLTAATALSATAPLDELASTASADPVATSPRAQQAPAGGDVAVSPAAATPAESPVGIPGVERPPGSVSPAVTTMSMDAPIQGGLTAHQAQAASRAVLAAHRTPGTADGGPSWTPAMGRSAAARARSWLGMPYSWAGGNASGPTTGVCDTSNGADLDCHIVGFDCSGLSSYAWGGYTGLPRIAADQFGVGEFHPSVKQLRAGDLVFFAGYLPGGIGHVAVYEGKGNVIEAPESGGVVRRSSLASLMASDGAYRGAVRPMTSAAPTLAATQSPLPYRGGTVTLHGKNLAAVTSVTIGTHTITKVQASASALRFRVPRGSGATTATVTTSWDAKSAPVTLTYAAKPATTAPTKPGSSTPGKSAPSKPTPGKSTPTTPSKPAPTKPAPTTTSPTTTPPTTPTTSAPVSTDPASSVPVSGSTTP